MSPGRRRWNLNREWRFTRGDAVDAHLPGTNDASWQRVGLPHCFDLPWFRTPEFYVGYAWYRKQREIPPDQIGRRFFLEFEGVFQVAEVFINGAPVGEHRGGYTGFSIDITGAVRAGGNLLAVRVNNLWNPQLSPRAGEHIFSGGIYRDVCLTSRADLHIPWNGTSVTTPRVSHTSATVVVTTEIRNDSGQPKHCTVQTRILDRRAQVVAAMTSSHLVPAGGVILISQTSDSIVHPSLWHPDHPHLYTAHTQVFDGDTLVDVGQTPFGIRFFEWTADRGFFLNGEHLYLRGANAHQDHAGWGIGITQAACRRDVKLIKDAGFNFVRGAHYPHHPAFAQACDELGLLFWSENAFWGKGGFGADGYWNASAYPVNHEDFDPFEQHARQSLREMIRVNRNHPSIIAWSMTNEAFFTYNFERAKQLMSDLVALSHDLDPTRPAAIGGAQRGEIDHLGDIAGYNGDGARLFINPGVPNLVSEYGAISKPHDAYDPFFGELQPERFHWRAGQAIWCGFDYGTIAGKQGLKGIIDHQRLPKRSWYWYRNEYRRIVSPQWPREGVPARLELGADKTTIAGTDATDDVQLVVRVLDRDGRHISNCPRVTLTIESGPGEFPTGSSITFDPETDIKIVEGQAAMAFRSYHGGQTLIRASSPGLADATITLTTDGEPQFVPGVTPSPTERPYAPPPVAEAAVAAMKNVANVALNRPCRATSEAEHHPARCANDGDTNSSWKALPDDPNPWWQVDLEGFYQISGSRLTFPAAENYRFRIHLSDDAQNWTLAVDQSSTDNARALRDMAYATAATARYVRITLTTVPCGVPAGLCAVEIHGVLSLR